MWDNRQVDDSQAKPLDSQGNSAMTLLAGGRRARRGRGPLLQALFLGSLGAAGIASIVYLLAPRWAVAPASLDAPRLPIAVAGVVFNIPPAAIRMSVQRRAGPQDRVDLVYVWPDLAPPDPHGPASAARLFVTIEASQSTMLPSERLKAIYPRYAETPSASGPGGLVTAAFRDDTPYQGEDLYYDPAAPDRFMVRCDRPHGALTLATCLYERPNGAAALTFRFPRDWLTDWQALSEATDRLIESWRPAGK
jgi:hypothetical protein